jgi:uncharacterized protein with FMN-binding domain
MKRAALAAPALFLAVVLLVNFKGPAATVVAVANDTGNRVASAGGSSSGVGGSTAAGAGTGTGSGTGSGTSGTSGSGAGAGSSGSGTNSGSSNSGTFQGQDIYMPYGDVQVEVTIKGGKITDVRPLMMPVGGHSGRIAAYVAPILRSEALAAQSANINIISGATYTSEAYAMSLQSALDAAKH